MTEEISGTLVSKGSLAFSQTMLGTVVPEPSTWAMMLLGFAALGYAGYRRTKRNSPAFAD